MTAEPFIIALGAVMLVMMVAIIIGRFTIRPRCIICQRPIDRNPHRPGSPECVEGAAA